MGAAGSAGLLWPLGLAISHQLVAEDLVVTISFPAAQRMLPACPVSPCKQKAGFSAAGGARRILSLW